VTESPITTALAESVHEVLEKMFFVDLMDPGAAEERTGDIAAEVIFDGDPPGTFRLDLERAAAKSAAADFLGEDPEELTTEQLNEVVCELANMVCGSVLSRIESSATFRLAKPRITPGECPPQAPATASFQALVGGSMLRAEIRMERTVCPGIDESAC